MSLEDAINIPVNTPEKVVYKDTEYKTLKHLCADLGKNYITVHGRIKRYGYSLEDAINKPAYEHSRNK
jgi:hypothetical protein